MLRPTKHNHPDQTVIYVAASLLKQLRKQRFVAFEDLRATARKAALDDDALFVPTLCFLHLLGQVEYRISRDAFEYVGPA